MAKYLNSTKKSIKGQKADREARTGSVADPANNITFRNDEEQ
jgi:hypothetical protein